MKENKELISIVLPVYNVERYIEKCLQSLIKQTYQNIEIILVDDGSPDNSISICRKYAKKDSRIKIYQKANGGLSDARNFGIMKATGEYICFVDSDDYVDDDYVEYLYYLIKKGDYKMSVCSLYNYYESNGKIVNYSTGEETVLNAKQAIRMMCYHDRVDTCAYAKLYHKSLFDNIKFPEGKLFEDIGTTYLFLHTAKVISCGFRAKYWYNIRENSIVTGSFNIKKFDLLEMTDQMAKFVNTKYPDLKKSTLRRQVYARFSTLNQILNVSGYIDEKKNIINFIKENSSIIMKDKSAPKRDKVAILLIKLGLPIYSTFWNLYLKVQRG